MARMLVFSHGDSLVYRNAADSLAMMLIMDCLGGII